MRTILHILTRADDELARQLIHQQCALPETKVEVIELTDGATDYDALLEKIFSVNSVEVW